MIGALLSLLRRVPVRRRPTACSVGRELGGATVGLVGMAPAARSMAQLLGGFGSQRRRLRPVAACAATRVWERWRSSRCGLRELIEQADARLRAARLLQPLSRAARRALPAVLQARPGAGQHRAFGPVRRGRAGRRADQRPHRGGLARQPGAGRARRGPAAARHRDLQVTPRVASTTRESRLRSAWAVARRIDELLERAERSASRRSASSTIASQRARLISKPIQCRREVGDALRLLLDDRGRRARDEALVGELGVRPWRSRLRGARFPWPGARARRRRRSRRAASGGRRRRRHRRSLRGRGEAASSSNTFTSRQLGQRLQQRRGLAR